jgi:TRAP-type C4-dicarboxylate transport system permease small subunit
MQRLLQIVSKISKGMNVIAAVALAFMILLTVADVILRYFRRPIIGTYEMVALSGAVIIGFSIPFTSMMKGHVNVDFLTLKLSPKGRKISNSITKCLGIILFLIIGWNLIILGMDFHKVGEVTPTRHLPIYPVLYGVGVCCFFESLVLLCDIVKILGGKYE